VGEEDVNIDPSVLEDKEDGYSSLTDKYNIKLFTDETRENINKTIKNKKMEEKEKKDILFTEKQNIKSNIYIDTKESLFLEERQITINDNYDELGSKEGYIFSGIFIFFFIIGTLLYYRLRRRRLDDISIDHFDE